MLSYHIVAFVTYIDHVLFSPSIIVNVLTPPEIRERQAAQNIHLNNAPTVSLDRGPPLRRRRSNEEDEMDHEPQERQPPTAEERQRLIVEHDALVRRRDELLLRYQRQQEFRDMLRDRQPEQQRQNPREPVVLRHRDHMEVLHRGWDLRSDYAEPAASSSSNPQPRGRKRRSNST